MQKGKEIYMYALGALIVLGILGVIVVLVYVPMPLGNKDALLVVVGAFAAKFADVVNYFYGSSKGSADKNEMLKNSGANNGNS